MVGEVYAENVQVGWQCKACGGHCETNVSNRPKVCLLDEPGNWIDEDADVSRVEPNWVPLFGFVIKG